MRTAFAIPTLAIIASCAHIDTEKRLEGIVSKMTLKEKITMLSGVNYLYCNIPTNLGIPKLVMADGPVGVCFDRKAYGDQAGPSTAYPAAVGVAASWDRGLVRRFGTAHAKDCRARGVHMILAPAVDIYRAPMCGRNFEYLGEDPYLAGEISSSYIDALQKQGVMACVKHYCCNNQEWNRYNISSDVDERTLREIYLPAFKAAVRKGGAWGVMSAYNLVNGTHASENKHILTDILKKEWGFKGFVVSDWGATHTSVKSFNAGEDLEMPTGKHFNYKNFKKALDNGSLKMERIDDAVGRILRGMVSMGFLDRPQKDKSIPLFPKEAAETALQMAREGIVMLKNKNDILPLDMAKIETIAVIGPNADPAVTGGGGSSKVTPPKSVSVLDAVKKRFKGTATIVFDRGIPAKPERLEILGLKGEYFDNTNFAGKPVMVRKDKKIRFNWKQGGPAKGIGKDDFSVRWTGTIKPAKSGIYEFILFSDDKAELFLDGKSILRTVLQSKTLKLKLDANRERKLELKYVESKMGAKVDLEIRRVPTKFPRAVKLAKNADVVILSAGFSIATEHEGRDRTFALPTGQDALIQAVAKANPNTIVVVNSGGNVEMEKWIGKIKALIMAWYPGENGNTALAEILAGDISPSGKLPMTFEKKWEDNPCHGSYYENTSQKGHIEYKEGIFVGYRGYDKNNIEPRFPFGFGLSYTTFNYDNLKIVNDGDKFNVSFDITNTGKRKGAEVAQIYIHDVQSSVPRPPKELKGFDRVELKPGETKRVSIDIPAKSLAFYDVASKSWKLEPGKFEVLVGASSRNIKLKGLKPQGREKNLASLPTSIYLCLQGSGQGSFCLCGIPGIMERTCRKQKSFAPQGLFALFGFIHLK